MARASIKDERAASARLHAAIDRAADGTELAQIDQALGKQAELAVIEPSRNLLAIARDERHRRALGEELHRRGHARARHALLLGDEGDGIERGNGALFRRLCTQAHAAGLLCAPSVGPGYDARLATRHEAIRPRNDGLTYDRMWKTALKAGPDIVTITSYNEWQEGTQIEPARAAVGKESYDGDWGKSGAAAQRAYLAATAIWTTRLNAAAG